MAASAEPPAVARKGRIPDFFIVGHPKSGTSALYRMLREHPQLHMPRKEPSFFVPELLEGRRYPNGIAEYAALFADAAAEQLVGEATTWYLASHDAAARIAEVQPDARIVAVLREPASFLRSLHLQFLRTDVETEPDFAKALALEDERRAGRRIPRSSTRPQLLLYSEHVRYVEQLRRYHDAFGREQVLVLIYDDFRADNEGTVREVLRFLDVDEHVPVQQVEANPSVGMRSARINGIVRSLYLGDNPAARLAKGAIKTVSSQRLRHGALATVRRGQREQAPPEDVALTAELRECFAGEVQSVSDYLGRDLTTVWGYGRSRD